MLAGLLPPFGRTEAFCVALEDKYGTHHSKFVLSAYDDRLRVCVSTANNNAGDHAQASQAARCVLAEIRRWRRRRRRAR